jgi:hypothetical protein
MNYFKYIRHERPTSVLADNGRLAQTDIAIAVTKQLGSVRWREKNRYFLTTFYLHLICVR